MKFAWLSARPICVGCRVVRRKGRVVLIHATGEKCKGKAK